MEVLLTTLYDFWFDLIVFPDWTKQETDYLAISIILILIAWFLFMAREAYYSPQIQLAKKLGEYRRLPKFLTISSITFFIFLVPFWIVKITHLSPYSDLRLDEKEVKVLLSKMDKLSCYGTNEMDKHSIQGIETCAVMSEDYSMRFVIKIKNSFEEKGRFSKTAYAIVAQKFNENHHPKFEIYDYEVIKKFKDLYYDYWKHQNQIITIKEQEKQKIKEMKEMKEELEKKQEKKKKSNYREEGEEFLGK